MEVLLIRLTYVQKYTRGDWLSVFLTYRVVKKGDIIQNAMEFTFIISC